MQAEAYLDMAKAEDRHWWFSGRRMVLKSQISSLGLPADARILEIGSGTGGNLEMLSDFGSVYGLEMDAVALDISREKTHHRFDIRQGFCPTDIPFNGQKFDLICMFDVLEHIEQDNETLVEVGKLLSSRGRALITVPAYQFLWGTHDRILHHKRRYTSGELQMKSRNAGLVVEKISYFNTFLFPLAAAARFKDRICHSNAPTGAHIPPYPMNSLLHHVFSAERHLLRLSSLPFGVSLLAILRKD
jgi:SAM-dependent methyltransferase